VEDAPHRQPTTYRAEYKHVESLLFWRCSFRLRRSELEILQSRLISGVPITLTTPGVSADSSGLFHGLGDHASNSFSVDGQPITDQQSKIFSNQLPSNSIQSIEVISGASPAECGDKTALSSPPAPAPAQGITKPTGDIFASYGAFGSALGGFDSSYGGKNGATSLIGS